MRFIRLAGRPDNVGDQAYYFCFSGNDVLIRSNREGGVFPLLTAEKAKESGFQDECFIGVLDDKPCFSVGKYERNVSDEYQWISLRDVYLNEERALSDVAGYAKQIFNWNINFRFCGRCGRETGVLPNEHARVCEKCRLINYPRISPAVIAAVIKGDEILLARSLKYQDKQMFSVLAGFLEPGESLEDCVKREIFEEAGINVKNVRYFKSQSWPFPDSLMIGFIADYESGDIRIDETEISEAGWFKANALPKVPGRRSISSELIRWFIDNNERQDEII